MGEACGAFCPFLCLLGFWGFFPVSDLLCCVGLAHSHLLWDLPFLPSEWSFWWTEVCNYNAVSITFFFYGQCFLCLRNIPLLRVHKNFYMLSSKSFTAAPFMGFKADMVNFCAACREGLDRCIFPHDHLAASEPCSVSGVSVSIWPDSSAVSLSLPALRRAAQLCSQTALPEPQKTGTDGPSHTPQVMGPPFLAALAWNWGVFMKVLSSAPVHSTAS